MNIFLLTIILIVNLISLILLLRKHPLIRPFPWEFSVVFMFVLIISGIYSGHIQRAVGFISLLSAVIITSSIHQFKYLHVAAKILSIFLVLFLAVDMLQIIHFPSENSWETWHYSMDGMNSIIRYLAMIFPKIPLDKLIHRPMAFESPNVKAAWLLLMPISAFTWIGVLIAMSRGALLGLLTIIGIRIPRKYWIPAAIGAFVIAVIVLLIRPDAALFRLGMWEKVGQVFINHPLFGVGSGNFIAAAPNANSHNALFTIIAENGLVGLVPLLNWIISIVLISRRSTSASRWNLLAFSVQQIVDDQWLGVITAILVGINLALLVSNIEPNKTDQ